MTIYTADGIFAGMNISASSLFTASSHETRLRCLLLLLAHEELCVCEFTHAIGAAQPHISRHLGQLREAGLVTDRREGLWIYYRISREIPRWVAEVLRSPAEGVGAAAPFADDLEKLRAMPNRARAPRCA